MYERDITDYTLPNKLADCPHCGLILRLYPFEFRSRPHREESRQPDDHNFEEHNYIDDWHLGAILRGQALRYSYRILRCYNEHMFIVVGLYTPTFDWSGPTRIRRFELLCDEDKTDAPQHQPFSLESRHMRYWTRKKEIGL